jgi:hypothetical protein
MVQKDDGPTGAGLNSRRQGSDSNPANEVPRQSRTIILLVSYIKDDPGIVILRVSFSSILPSFRRLLGILCIPVLP